MNEPIDLLEFDKKRLAKTSSITFTIKLSEEDKKELWYLLKANINVMMKDDAKMSETIYNGITRNRAYFRKLITPIVKDIIDDLEITLGVIK